MEGLRSLRFGFVRIWQENIFWFSFNVYISDSNVPYSLCFALFIQCETWKSGFLICCLLLPAQGSVLAS